MNASPFYRAADAQHCQGDIFERIPHVLVKEQPHLLRRATLPKNKRGYEIEELSEGALPRTPSEGGLVPTICHGLIPRAAWARFPKKAHQAMLLHFFRFLAASRPEPGCVRGAPTIMIWIALKMLIGNRGRYYAIVFGIAFACMLMAQQASIFVGLMRNTTSQIRDIQGADIWVMNPSVEFVDDITPLSDNDLYRVRGVSGVLWAVPLYKGTARAQFPEGFFKQFIVLGLDDESLVALRKRS